MARRYIDGSGNLIPSYAMPIERDTASLTNAAYLKGVANGDIVPDVKPPVTTTAEESLSTIGYVNSTAPDASPFVAPDIDDIGLTSLVNIGTVNMELEASIIPVESVSLNKSTTSLAVGATETLIATVLPTNATNKSVLWESSSTSVATVSNAGLVTAVAEGATVIAVITVDGTKTASCTVSVTAA